MLSEILAHYSLLGRLFQHAWFRSKLGIGALSLRNLDSIVELDLFHDIIHGLELYFHFFFFLVVIFHSFQGRSFEGRFFFRNVEIEILTY